MPGESEGGKIEDFEPRFQNWLRWCYEISGEPVASDRAHSLEGLYSGPQGKGHPTGWGDWDEAAPPHITIPIPIDHWDALLINRAYWQLGEKIRRTIKILWFRKSWGKERQARKIGVHQSTLDDVAEQSKAMLKNRLRFVEQKHKIRVRVVPIWNVGSKDSV
jgi:hypothetical protein